MGYFPLPIGRRSTGVAATVRALLVPADLQTTVRVITVKNSAVANSEAIGGGLIDDSVTGDYRGTRFALYRCEDRADQQDNPRAAVLAARLGLTDRALLASMRGDVLVTGLARLSNDDVDVPAQVVELQRHLR